MIRSIKILRLSLLICLISLFITIPVLAMPTLPSSFYGMVKMNGNRVPDDTVVEALINSKVYAKGYIQTYQGNSIYTLDIPGDDTDTVVQDGGRDGETIQFMVGGVLAGETGIWKSATNINLDLNLDGVVGGIAEPQDSRPLIIPTQTSITINQSSPTSAQTSAADPIPAQTIAPLMQASPIPTQTQIVQIQPSSIPTSSIQSTQMAVLPNEFSLIPTTINSLSTPPADSENNSSNGNKITAVAAVAFIAAGSIFFIMRRKINIVGKSDISK